MTKWIVEKNFDGKIKLRNPILVEGLPGVGNVGKIAVDFLIDSLNPSLLYKIYSYLFPHSVFLNEKNQIELPSVSIFNYEAPKRNILFLSGDVQPVTEKESYEFCEKILDYVEELGCREIITLGGIGLPSKVNAPTVFGAVTDENTYNKYKKFKNIKFSTSEKVDAIVGASGLLLGLARLRGISGVSLLTETYANQYHLGFLEAKTVLFELQKILKLKELDFSPLEKEIKLNNRQIRIERDETEAKHFKKIKTPMTETKPDIRYIG